MEVYGGAQKDRTTFGKSGGDGDNPAKVIPFSRHLRQAVKVCDEAQKDKTNSGNSDGDGDNPPKVRVIIIGGSIAGLCCAHALLKSGVCRVMVLEKSRSLGAAGAGLAIDQAACEALEHWGLRDQLFRQSKPLDAEENRAVDAERRVFVTLCRDEEYRNRAVHWSDLHRILYNSLPAGIAHLGHEAISLQEDEDRSSINVSVLVTGADEDKAHDIKEVQGDIIVAADGSMSRTRQFYLPHEKRRYSGYCAWRGVLDYSDESQLYLSIKTSFPDIGECLYFEIAPGSHAVLYELPGKRLNWLWYINQPEPELKGVSVTVHPDEETIAAMHDEADRTWMPELAQLMKLTPKPFINAIYDKDPLKQLAWKRVVLVGEAAHPTTPHGLRSTNMSIMDAFELGKAFQKWGSDQTSYALAEYESKRLPVSSQQVLFSRHLGKLKQGLLFEPKGSFPWPTADDSMVEGLLQKNMNFFQWNY